MAESVSANSQTETSPLTGPSSVGTAVDAQGLQTVHELPRRQPRYDDDDSLDNRLLSKREPPADLRDASPDSFFGRNYSEKQLEASPRRLRHTAPAHATPEAWQRVKDPSTPLRNGNYRDMRRESALMTTPPKKERKAGFRNTLRRMFTRRPTRDRISMPNPTVYPHHDPEEFITSATDVQAKRSASVPTNGVLRTSGLGSHPPFQNLSSPAGATINDVPSNGGTGNEGTSNKATSNEATSNPFPPQPERLPPERPARPRRASVPSVILNRPEVQEVEDAMTGLGLQTNEEQPVDAHNIGFAVTNGSNPKRRSRSVGAFRDTEHRMSPIQWRRWRRRSDEIKYWRQSTELGSLGIKSFESPDLGQKEDADAAENDHCNIGQHNEEFNFGLPADAIQDQDRIGLEERIVTLEIKLMDFEYAISKLQAGSTSSSRRHSERIDMAGRQNSVDSYLSSDHRQAPIEASPGLPQETPPVSPSKFAHESAPQQRPTSVATTLKASAVGPYTSARRGTTERSSLTGLTIEHYTTLITLIRHEQSSRVRLEQQVSMLQQQVDRMSPTHSSHSHGHSLSHHSQSRSLSSQQRRHGFVDVGNRGGHYRQPRPRSSSYSTNETDTDDDIYHDVYVTPDITPVERGEYERGAFERVAGVEEGMAF
ncbi:hypothetical protein IMSHALPRED_006958 [Imshaugia aleurites]|uniref:Uncharacterized protein n=1 Tax=Imshaugia aleurites TaxID=172621 RepID=A0A8H3ITZ5_9LECA|nr:hypothetical protein IMSHALPRED_006958 [Imshaugia aleurites]